MADCDQVKVLEFFQQKLDEHEQRLNSGALVLQELKTMAEDTHEGVKSLTVLHKETNKRLFVDNGVVSVQTKLDRFSRFQKTTVWVSGVVLVAFLSGLVTYLFSLGGG